MCVIAVVGAELKGFKKTLFSHTVRRRSLYDHPLLQNAAFGHMPMGA